MNCITPANRRPNSFLFAFLILATSMRAQEVLTNETVISMAKAHLSDKLIVEMIQSNPGRYSVTSSALIALKQQGVSDAAIAAMRAKADMQTATTSKQPVATTRNSSPEPPDAGWRVVDVKDEITGESKFEGRLREKVSNGGTGRFDVTAICAEAGLLFKVAFLSDPNPGYKLTNLRPSPKVVARVAIDGRVTSAVSSVPEFSNEAQFLFAHKQSDRGMAFWAAFLKGTAGISVTDISPEELYGAKGIKMEMPLGNGALPILELRPQDPEFQKFAVRCKTAEAELARNEREQQDKRAAATAAAQAQRQQDELVRKAGESSEALEAAAITVDEFPDMLAAALKERGPEFGADTSLYGAAIRTVANIVRLCSSISAAEFAASMDTYGIPHLLRYKAGKYKDCITPAIWQGVPEGKEVRGFLISFDLEKRWQRERKDWEGPKLHMDVYLKETRQVTPISLKEYQRRCVLLSRDIRDRTDIADIPSGLGSPAGALTQSTDASSRAVVRENPAAATAAAVMTVISGFPKPLTWGHYWLLRDDPATALKNGGIQVPKGMTADEVMRSTCQSKEAACKKITQALDADGVAKVNADATGRGVFTSVAPGNYYLMVSVVYSNRLIIWNQRVELKAGANSAVFTNTNQER